MELKPVINEPLEIESISSKKRHYTQDFKDQIIAVYKSGVYDSVDACAKAYDISSKSLYRWLQEYSKSITPKALSDHQAELSRIKKELAKIKMENEILKKAAIYFANQAR